MKLIIGESEGILVNHNSDKVPNLFIKYVSDDCPALKILVEDYPTLANIQELDFDMIIGIIPFFDIPHLIIVTKSCFAGEIKGKKIFKIEKVEAIPISKRLSSIKYSNSLSSDKLSSPDSPEKYSSFKFLKHKFSDVIKSSVNTISSKSEEILDSEQNFVSNIVKYFLSTFNYGNFYFSFDFDLTNSFQRYYEINTKRNERSKMNAFDSRFFWNKFMLRHFPDEWKIPVVQGFVRVETCSIEDNEFQFILLSRRSCLRAGLRYEKRGVDADGNVANFVETEQIVIIENPKPSVASFLQIRGSVPLFWNQNSRTRKPPVNLERTKEENIASFTKHINGLQNTYGNLAIINLLEDTGNEGVLNSEFHSYAMEIKNIKYQEFNVHRGKFSFLNSRMPRYEI